MKSSSQEKGKFWMPSNKEKRKFGSLSEACHGDVEIETDEETPFKERFPQRIEKVHRTLPILSFSRRRFGSKGGVPIQAELT